jgi:hypothetical protein
MTELAYSVAIAAASRIHRHFELLLGSPSARAVDAAPLADRSSLEAILNVAFWASLRREEGFAPRVSIALVPPERIQGPLLLGRPLAITPETLTKVAPAVDRPGVHLGVWPQAGEPVMWGITDSLPPYCLVIEIIAPGLMVIKCGRVEGAGKFVNIAVIEGDQTKVINQNAARVPDCPAILTPLLGLESQFRSEDSAGTLIQLAVSMREHGRGGTLLVVPAEEEEWRTSILAPTLYAVNPPFSLLADTERPSQRDIDGVAGLTAADGATILNDRFEVLAFGAKIIRKLGSPLVNQVTLSEPIEGDTASVIEPAQLGGTRHISAAQFTHDQQKAIAMVASQDGRFTLFGWSPCDGMVHARRVESLLL